MSSTVRDLALDLGRRARAAFAAGEPTFAVPELLPAAAALGDAPGFLAAGAGYHDLCRRAARFALADAERRPPAELVYVPKAAAELEPMLDLWPDVLLLPTTATLSPADLIELRALPVHPLGLVSEATWGDGRLLSPADYFFHDLDHARFKVREDLRALGITLPDAYEDGTTLDPRTGLHRTILPAARGRVGVLLWERVAPRLDLARRLLDHARQSPAAELLLSEILHEKSFPLSATVLRRELDNDAHLDKIRAKHRSGFYGVKAPPPEVIAALEGARLSLQEIL